MQPRPLGRGKGLENSLARQLMSELDSRVLPLQYASGDALVNVVGLGRRDRTEDLRLTSRTKHRRGPYDLGSSCRQTLGPGPDRLTDGGRHADSPGGEHLGDEERVPSGHLVQRPCVDGGPSRQLLDSTDGQRRQSYRDRRRRWYVSKRDRQRMVRSDLVVAVRGDHQGAELSRPTSNDPQHLESGLVRPLHVLENRDPRAAVGTEKGKKCRDDPMPVGIGEGRLQYPSDLIGDVEYRREGTGRDHGVADPPKDTA